MNNEFAINNFDVIELDKNEKIMIQAGQPPRTMQWEYVKGEVNDFCIGFKKGFDHTFNLICDYWL